MDPLALKACTVELRALRVVRPDGSVAALSAREADVLRYLVERSGQAVDRDTLYVEIWGYHHAVLSRAVDALIRRLRGKIEADPAAPEHLLTVHGEGYRFEPLPAAEAPADRILVAVGRDPLEEADRAQVASWVERIDRRARSAGGAPVARFPEEDQQLWSFRAPAVAIGFCAAAVDAGAGLSARGAVGGELDRVRTMATATAPGRVLAEEALYDPVALASGVRDRTWRRLGGIRLTWDEPPLRLVETGGVDGAPGLRGADGNLVPPPNRTIGRDPERDDALARLAGARVLTLTGTGGVGKTRLAREIGLAWRATGAGAWFCDLSSCRSAEEVVLAVARSLDLPPTGLAAALPHVGGDLVILDNAEQALDAVRSAVAGWRDVERGPRWLVTSRERLGLAGEEVLELRPLSAADGAALYAERCRALGLAVADPGAVDALVARVGGLPLAVELAAGRSELVSPAEIVARLDRSPEAVGRDPTRTPRQADLRASVRWSWELLAPFEQEVLAACALFAAPFDPAGAVAVDGRDEDRVLEALHGLRRKNLLASVPADPAPARLTPYPAVKAFAAEQLAEAAAMEVRDRHARWFARWGTDEGRSSLHRPGGVEAELRLRADLPDLVAAFEHAAHGAPEVAVDLLVALVAHASPAETERQAQIALELGGDPVRIHLARAHGSASIEVAREVDRLLVELAPNDPRALKVRAEIALRHDRPALALPLLEQALPHLRETDDLELVGALYLWAACLDVFERSIEHTAALAEILDRVVRAGDRKGECIARMQLARKAITSGDLDRGLRDALAAHALMDEIPSPNLRMRTAYALCQVHLLRDEPGPAARAGRSALRDARRHGTTLVASRAAFLLSVIAGDYRGADEGRRWVSVAREIEREAASGIDLDLDGWLGELALAAGDLSEALGWFDPAIDQARATGQSYVLRRSLMGRGVARLEVGDVAGARSDVDEAASGLRAEADPMRWAHVHSVRAVVRARAGDLDGAESDLAIAASVGSTRLDRLKLRVCEGLVAATADRPRAASIAAEARAEADRRGLGPTTRVGARLASLERLLAEP